MNVSIGKHRFLNISFSSKEKITLNHACVMLNSELRVATWKGGLVVVIDSSPRLLFAMWSSNSQNQKARKPWAVHFGIIRKGYQGEDIGAILLLFNTVVCLPHFEYWAQVFCPHLKKVQFREGTRRATLSPREWSCCLVWSCVT